MVISGVVGALLMVGLPLTAAPASAQEPVYEITGQWVERPATIARGNPVVAEWRINVNDGENPPSNAPVDDVTATFTVDKAFFDEIPDLCKTDGVDPPSSISADRKTLTCNFGTVNMGTAIVVQTPVVADGLTGDEIALSGTAPDGQKKDLPRIPIKNPFMMDMHFGTNTSFEKWNDKYTYVDVDVQWSLRLGKGSDPGPKDVTYRLNVADIGGHNVNVGRHPNSGAVGCSPYGLGGTADGHPYSSNPGANPRQGNFVQGCTLTEVPGRPGVFDLTLKGIDYSLANLPEEDSAGNPLPRNWDYVASGALWFRVITDEAGSIQLEMNPKTYTSPTGLRYPDPPVNNDTNKSYTLPGEWAAAWRRAYTKSGGTSWDDTYRVSAGTTVQQIVNNHANPDGSPADARYGQCLAFDTRYVTFEGGADSVQVYAVDAGTKWTLIDSMQVEYYTGNSALLNPQSPGYEPDDFDCASDPGGWTTTPPTAPADVKAVRIRYPYSSFGAENADYFSLWANTTIKPDVRVGQDVWMFGSALRDGTWRGVGDPWDSRVITRTRGARYPATNGRRDILRIISAEPYIEKAADQSTVTPGKPAGFTLTYSANGSGIIPKTVDDYVIRDVLPRGMTYQPGSADPEPTVTTDAQGRQVLTWQLDDVTTNVEHKLAYQAVVEDSVPPGTQLTNTAQSSYGGQKTEWVPETVTTTTNGYTTILKTSDVEYIPNVDGDGIGKGSWTVTIESFDPLPQAFTDTIDILPYNGDGRGTSFSGTYTLDDMTVPAGATIYYTDADPSTLVDDPAHKSNGKAGDPTGNTASWTTTRPDNPTAIRVIGPRLAPGGTFSFRVPITTNGAQPRDTYVNRAQARAEHTELVMRTSAVLVVTDYLVEKTSDPKPGSVVAPGDKVTYTVTVTQQGDVPAGAVFRDGLSDVFDDATYNNDVKADIGEATLDDSMLSWKGEIPVGGKATVTYSVTVNDTDEPSELYLENVVTSPGCYSPAKCTTYHTGKGRFEVSKTSDPAPGSKVAPGDKVTYQVLIVQRGRGPANGARITDNLADVLDDATWNGDLRASAGRASLAGSTLTWTGDLQVGAKVALTYSVTYKGDGKLHNLVTPGEGGTCVPAPDGNPGCQTEHTPAPALPHTGAGSSLWLLAGGLVPLLLAGLVIAYTRRRAND